jgi:hypothetical protein
VLGAGVLGLVVVIGAVAVVLAARSAADRQAMRTPGRRARGSGIARLAAGSGAPVSVIAGIRFAFEPSRGRTAVPVRSAMLGAVLAVATVAATLTFGSSLTALVSHPPLYGWNWSYVLQGVNIPPQSQTLLDYDPLIAGWTGVEFIDLEIAGQVVPAIVTDADADARVSPPILAGHQPDSRGQLVLGAQTLRELHKHIGDVVYVSYGAPDDAPFYIPPTRETIVGTSTLPAIGEAQSLHTSMGTGALIPSSIAPPALQKALTRTPR